MDDFFSGRVHSVVFDNSAQDFYILKMVLDSDGEGYEEGAVLSSRFRVYDPQPGMTSVRGNIYGLSLQPGTWFGFRAQWTVHEKYGKQLLITEAPVIEKWDLEIGCSLLLSHGVGEHVVGVLRDKLKNSLIDALDKGDVAALASAVGEDTAKYVLTRWLVGKTFFKTLEFLNKAGIPKNKISQVWARFSGDAEEVLSANPWALVEIEGITFPQADEVAVRLGLNLDVEERLQGAILHAIKTRKGMGHVYLSSGEVAGEVAKIIPNVTPEVLGRCLGMLHKRGGLVIDRETRPGTTAIYDPWLHQMEGEGTRLLRERVETAALREGTDLYANYVKGLRGVGSRAEDVPSDGTLHDLASAALQDWSAGSHLALTKDQLLGALNGLTQPVSILTGLPGSGKTTLLKAVVNILQDAEVPFLLVAPTGIAAKRITSLTGAQAATIHRAFGAQGWNVGGEREATYAGITGNSAGPDGSDGSGEDWGCSLNPHPADVIVIDETSMVDQHLLYRILTCTKPTTRIMLVGDAAQLPSVGPGNVLRDMIGSGLFPMVNLVDIFRQEEASDIILAARAVFSGDVPKVKADSSSDFVFIEVSDEDKILDIICRLAQKLYDKRSSFQIMSPRHAGTLGVTNLNSRLRELLNPKSPGLQEMRVGSEIVREDDRVMVVQNNYQLGVYNGDFGKVARLDRALRIVDIKVHGPIPTLVHFPLKEASSCLRLAYAVTVHKMQGQEAGTIVMPLVKSFQHQLQRNLLYTAITRARERVILVGHREALVKAVFNDRPDVRNTLFLERLQKVFH